MPKVAAGLARAAVLGGLLLAACTDTAGPSTADPTTQPRAQPRVRSTPVSYVPPTVPPRPTVAALHDSSPELVPAFVDVEIDDGSIGVSEPSVVAEEVYFTVYNLAGGPHELMVVRTNQDPAALPLDPVARAVSLEQVAGKVESMESGSILVFEIEPIEPGRYILLCNLPGHYETGEYASLEVVAP